MKIRDKIGIRDLSYYILFNFLIKVNYIFKSNGIKTWVKIWDKTQGVLRVKSGIKSI